jgi:hypothetical protein
MTEEETRAVLIKQRLEAIRAGTEEARLAVGRAYRKWYEAKAALSVPERIAAELEYQSDLTSRIEELTDPTSAETTRAVSKR